MLIEEITKTLNSPIGEVFLLGGDVLLCNKWQTIVALSTT
jgi:hypothetical protein